MQRKKIMNRFFVNKTDSKKLAITEDDYKHAKKVLRLKAGDEVYAIYEDKEYIGKILLDEEDKYIISLIEETKVKREADINIHLFQSLPKSNKMDYIIQKNVEIGVKNITPVISNRSLIKIDSEKKEKKKLERWNKISGEAAKQSMRNYIPKVEEIMSFQEMIIKLKIFKEKNDAEIVIPYEEERSQGIKDIEINKNNFIVIIGPEGGFEKEEVKSLVDIGAKSITLGPRILRTETAGLVLNSIILYKTKNMEN